MEKLKVICIVGPTASGKSALGILLAKKFNGEIISADSRQVYRGMDIGSGKVTKHEMQGVPHHLLDVASPRSRYSVSRYQRDAKKALGKIFKKGRLPIVVGGTGLYIDALVFDRALPEVPPNTLLRKRLEKLSNEKLFLMLQKLDPRRASEIDRHNPRRLIRAIEIAAAIGKVPSLAKKQSPYKVLWIGIEPDPKLLQKNIRKRLISRMKNGMGKEVAKLHRSGLSWKRLESFGLEYKYLALFLQKKLTGQEMLEKLELESNHYAKRQYTWFKQNKKIHWIDPDNKKSAEKLVTDFLL